MFGLWKRPRRPAARPAGRRARLCLEALEARDCPSSSVLSLSATPLPGHVAQVSGTLYDPLPGGAQVVLGGAVSGTTVTDSSGQFTFSTTQAALGTVTAYAVDQLGATSNTAVATLAVAAPTVTFTITAGPDTSVTISGWVADLDPCGQVVQFTGAVTASVLTNPDGTFRLTTAQLEPGAVTASTTDAWGLASPSVQQTATMQQTAMHIPPVISSFSATEGTNYYWTFSGQVSDGSTAGLVVTLGGLPALSGVQLTVNSNGSFSICLQLQSGESGTATAQATDSWGLTSAVAYACVDPT